MLSFARDDVEGRGVQPHHLLFEQIKTLAKNGNLLLLLSRSLQETLRTVLCQCKNKNKRRQSKPSGRKKKKKKKWRKTEVGAFLRVPHTSPPSQKEG